MGTYSEMLYDFMTVCVRECVCVCSVCVSVYVSVCICGDGEGQNKVKGLRDINYYV